jgi:ketosteroid isomerase-like protein
MLTSEQVRQIKAEVLEAASIHLQTTDLPTALSHFTDDIVAVSNQTIYPSLEALKDDISQYYKFLKSVNHASWKETHISVISDSAAIFTAKFDYGFTDHENATTNLTGVWTALFIRKGNSWKIRLRHESFETV